MDKVNDQIVESSLESESILIENTQVSLPERETSSYTRKRHGKEVPSSNGVENASKTHVVIAEEKRRSWRRILLLIVAITVHNIPGKWIVSGVHLAPKSSRVFARGVFMACSIQLRSWTH